MRLKGYEQETGEEQSVNCADAKRFGRFRRGGRLTGADALLLRLDREGFGNEGNKAFGGFGQKADGILAKLSDYSEDSGRVWPMSARFQRVGWQLMLGSDARFPGEERLRFRMGCAVIRFAIVFMSISFLCNYPNDIASVLPLTRPFQEKFNQTKNPCAILNLWISRHLKIA